MPPRPRKYEDVSEVARKIQQLRGKRSQTEFAALLHERFGGVPKVTPSSLSKWESGRARPVSKVLAKFAEIASGELSSFFLREAGAVDALSLNIYKSAGAGAFRFVDEEADQTVVFPRAWLPASPKLVGIVVEGSSMSPIIESGFIVIVDRAKKTLEEARGRIIAASDDGGVAIRTLEKRGDTYWLVPRNEAGHSAAMATPTTRIIGVVVKWIGQPTPHRK